MSSIDISILMPVYNGEKYIKKAIDSILNQSFRNWELIIVDDGSTDNSGKICDKFAIEDSRISVIHQENHGISYTRNLLISEAKGKYIGFIDCDDNIRHDAFEILFNNIEKYKSDLTICGFTEQKMDEYKIISQVEKIYYPNEYLLIKDMNNLIMNFSNSELLNPLWNKLYKREIIERYNLRFPKNIENGEDLIFNLDYISNIKSISFCKESLYYYAKRNNGSITHKYVEDMYYKGLDIHNHLEDFLKKMEFYSEENQYILAGNHLMGVFSACLNLFHKDCDLSFSEKHKYIRSIIDREYVKLCANKHKYNKSVIGIMSNLIRINNIFIIIFVFKLLSIYIKVK